jgi:hypothetical protein
MKRLSYLVATGLLLATTIGAVPVHAQAGGPNTGNTGCTQATTGGGGATTGGRQSNRSDSRAVLVGLIDVLVQDVQALNNLDIALSALNGSNLQVVCLNDVLNQNDIRLLQDILNGSPILSNDLNNSLNNNTVLNNLLRDSNIALLNNVSVVAINLGTGQVFLLRQT